jgi:hypothetical protein
VYKATYRKSQLTARFRRAIYEINSIHGHIPRCTAGGSELVLRGAVGLCDDSSMCADAGNEGRRRSAFAGLSASLPSSWRVDALLCIVCGCRKLFSRMT